MILFIEDWSKYPNAIVDYKTTNDSFIRVCALYKKMGVKNYLFPLQLHDARLQGIDPFDPNLTKEQIGMIITECKVNPFYFFREIARAPSPAGAKPFRFKANRANMALFWLFFNHITALLIQPRQTGKSFSTRTLMRLILNVGAINTQINMLTKDNTLRVSEIEGLKKLEKELPYYLRMTTKKDADNMEKITVKALGNTYITHVAQKSEDGARNIGRGLTSPIFHIDEIAYIYNNWITVPAALAAGGAARDAAKINNSPYGTIFTTTAGRLDTKMGKFAYSILESSAKWTEKFLDAKNLEELERIITLNSPGNELTVSIVFNHRQLGFTDEWLRRKMQDARSKGEDAEADFLNKWVSGSEAHPIADKDILEKIDNSKRLEPNTEITNYGYVLRWYISDIEKERLKNKSFIIGLDTSDAVGKDDIAMVFTDTETGAVIAAGNYNETNLITFSEWVVEILLTYRGALLIPERKLSGGAIIDNIIKLLLMEDEDPFKRIFNWVVQEALEKPEKFKEINVKLPERNPDVYIKFRKDFGYATSGSGKASRDNLYGESLLPAAKYTGDKVHDPILVSQILGLTVRNGRIDHRVGGKDDMVITWLLNYWLLVNGQTMSFYGIPVNKILSKIVTSGSVSKENIEERIHLEEQQQLKEAINFLIEKLREEKDEVRSMKIRNKINFLSKDLDTKVIQGLNINAVLTEIENLKKQQKMNRSKQWRRY